MAIPFCAPAIAIGTAVGARDIRAVEWFMFVTHHDGQSKMIKVMALSRLWTLGEVVDGKSNRLWMGRVWGEEGDLE